MLRSKWSRNSAISAAIPRRAETISTSAKVPAEISISSSAASAALHGAASDSWSTIAIKAEVSTVITLGRSLRQTVLVIKEILAARGAGSGRRLLGSRALQFFEQRPARFPVQPFLDRDQPHCRMAMPGQDDFVARLGAAHQLGQLRLGVGDGDFHSAFPLSSESRFRLADSPIQGITPTRSCRAAWR